GNKVLGRLKDTGVVTIEDPRAPLIVLEALSDLGKATTDNHLGDIAAQIVFILGDIGERAARMKMEAIATKAAGILGSIGNRSIKGNDSLKEVANSAANILGDVIGRSATENGLHDTALQIADILGQTSVEAIGNGANETARHYSYGLRTLLSNAGGAEAAARGIMDPGATGDFPIIEGVIGPRAGMDGVAIEAVYALHSVAYRALAKCQDRHENEAEAEEDYEYGDEDLEKIILAAALSFGAVGVEAANRRLGHATFVMQMFLRD
ncbi:unnamed protein product, partial [marine sediment metagenome]